MDNFTFEEPRAYLLCRWLLLGSRRCDIVLASYVHKTAVPQLLHLLNQLLIAPLDVLQVLGYLVPLCLNLVLGTLLGLKVRFVQVQLQIRFGPRREFNLERKKEVNPPAL